MSLKFDKGTGEGIANCKRCLEKGKWIATWVCFLYKIEGHPGYYCSKCLKEIEMEELSNVRK